MEVLKDVVKDMANVLCKGTVSKCHLLHPCSEPAWGQAPYGIGGAAVRVGQGDQSVQSRFGRGLIRVRFGVRAYSMDFFVSSVSITYPPVASGICSVVKERQGLWRLG